MPNPLCIPEILGQIAEYIETRYVLDCVVVSKSWSLVFLPKIWNEICFEHKKPIALETALSKYAHLITSLKIIGEIPLYVTSTPYPSLKKLFLTGSTYKKYQFSTILLSNNPTIENLSIQHHVHVPDYFEFHKSISNLHNLTRLYIASHYVPQESARTFWNTICRIQSARLINIWYPRDLTDLKETPHNLKHLEIGGWRDQREIEVITKCTELEYLKLERLGRLFSPVIFADCFKRSTWPNLHRFELHVNLDNTQLELVLNSISRLSEFAVPNSIWGIESFHALSPHFKSLEKLYTLGGGSFTSVMLNTIMSSCPILKELTAVEIHSEDIINNNQISGSHTQSQGWVCSQLKLLHIGFTFEDPDSRIQVLERIATLTQLSTLNLRTPLFTLDEGLDILKPLKYLTSVNIGRRMPNAEKEWISKNWKRIDIAEYKFF